MIYRWLRLPRERLTHLDHEVIAEYQVALSGPAVTLWLLACSQRDSPRIAQPGVLLRSPAWGRDRRRPPAGGSARHLPAAAPRRRRRHRALRAHRHPLDPAGVPQPVRALVALRRRGTPLQARVRPD